MGNIYVSYNGRDKDLAQQLAAGLKALGHSVTLDVDCLVPGRDWRADLRDALERSDGVVALISSNSLSAQYVLSEVGAARALRKYLIPVVVGDIGFPTVVNDLHCLHLDDNNIDETIRQISNAVGRVENRRVFIVHGQNEAKKLELKDFLKDLDLQPIILHQQDDLGKTIIEKFEHYAAQSAFAFVLLTPDDQVHSGDTTESKWRARQNVILELGWFMAKLGRERVVLLYKGELEIPTDILGIVYLKFNDSIKEVSEQIRQRLKGAGLIK